MNKRRGIRRRCRIKLYPGMPGPQLHDCIRLPHFIQTVGRHHVEVSDSDPSLSPHMLGAY